MTLQASVQPFCAYIDNEPIRGGALDQVNPATGSVWATVPACTEDEVERAAEAADRASAEWRRMRGRARADVLFAFADRIEAEAEHLARLESLGSGKVIRESRAHVAFAARMLRYYAGVADKLFGRVVPLDVPDALDYYVYEPYGVVAAIVAWNSPIQLAINKIAPALAAGNAIVLKPSSLASVSLCEMGRLWSDAALPAGVLNVLTGGVGESLVRHPRVSRVSLTGGTDTGRRVAALAGERLVPITLELGGKSANIVLDDADIPSAVAGVAFGIFAAAGQTCVAGSRLLVHESIAEEFLARLVDSTSRLRVGDPLDEATDMGPLISASHRERVLGIVRTAQGDGASLLTGGHPLERAGFFMDPTILTDVASGMKCVREEIFGPVLTAQTFASTEQAVSLANDTSYGLAAGIWTTRLQRGVRIAADLHVGTVWINDYRVAAAGAPMGGVKGSGYGRERGMETILDYSRAKNVYASLAEAEQDPFRMGA